MKKRPILVGDLFKDSKGRTWKVTRTHPPGRVELFCREESLFMDTYCKQIRDWERIR